MAQHIHVIFKTHLDVGFTHYAETVTRQYMESYIPRAIALARALREAGDDTRFVWTTGSWLIDAYLERADAAGRQAMEAAILAGDIRWHALPFTMHCEAMEPSLFRYGLSLSQRLDRRFGATTIAAKMTDVPGHTRGIVPLLAEAGVRFLHIGVNPACPAPEVPDLFRWRDDASGAELLVMYHKDDYGCTTTIDSFDHALVFAHTGDNLGPQSPAQLRQDFQQIRAEFPGGTVTASTLDAFAAPLLAIADRFPVVTAEIGDSWIHGLGTDPYKVAAFRALCRLRAQWLAAGRLDAQSPQAEGFSRHLLLVPEHTWGLDEKSSLGDYRHYTRVEFDQARVDDTVADDDREEFARYRPFRTPDRPQGFRAFAASWAEQRAYLTRAIEALGEIPLAGEARQAIADLRPQAAPGDLDVPLATDAPLRAGAFTVRLDPATGALSGLRDARTGTEWAGAGHLLGLFRYQTLSSEDFDRYLREYAVRLEQHGVWAIPDLGKPGLRLGDSPHAWWEPVLQRASQCTAGDTTHLRVHLAMPEEAHQRFGAPATVVIDYTFTGSIVDIALCWFDKPANRMPEACWCTFNPAVDTPELWQLAKLGETISPLEVIAGGNRNLHGIDSGCRYAGADGTLHLASLDAALVAPGRPRLLEFDRTLPDLAGGMHINLYNNIYGTNFPMWYEENARFRFRLTL